MKNLRQEFLRVLKLALKEDKANRDLTTDLILKKNPIKKAKGILLAKQKGIFAGTIAIPLTFSLLPGSVRVQLKKKDGQTVKQGEIIATLEGSVESLLAGERTLLNLLQHLSGIATETQRYVQAVAGTKVKILDTRKTLSGLRLLEKWAVLMGGGENHRFSLADGILIKENHIKIAGSIRQAIEKFSKDRNNLILEVRNLSELQQALQTRVKRILLDNFPIPVLKKAVKLAVGRTKLESSGGVTLKNVRAIARTGVDYISIGRLTHSAPALDMSFLLESC
ncbi:MAG: carboxylating nicotinate-nucleotide diphosphorylase [Deltaproteobacteria bacterium]|nr:carboxylating nicotinate-nucleotide diphosphorylase [Deltaproteobacteria bacterium]